MIYFPPSSRDRNSSKDSRYTRQYPLADREFDRYVMATESVSNKSIIKYLEVLLLSRKNSHIPPYPPPISQTFLIVSEAACEAMKLLNMAYFLMLALKKNMLVPSRSFLRK